MSKKTEVTLATRYLDLLSEEGYRPKLGPTHGCPVITFKHEGDEFLLFVDEDHETFFHLGIAYDLGPIDVPTALDRANQLNEELKVVKVTIAAEDRSVRFHVEAFLDQAPARMEQVERSLGALSNAAERFFEAPAPVRQLDA